MSQKTYKSLDLDSTVIIEVEGGVVIDTITPRSIKTVLIVDRDEMKLVDESEWAEEYSQEALDAIEYLDKEGYEHI